MKKEWSDVLDEVSKHIPPKYYENFISPLSFSEITEDKYCITAPSTTIKSHVEKKYLKYIEDAIYSIKGNKYSLEITVSQDLNLFKDIVTEKFSRDDDIEFNPDYTFNNYIVGETNKIAFYASKEVCKDSSSINPLYIFGNVGTGKTHLLHAIGSTIKKSSPWKSVKYVDLLSFMNEFTYMVGNRQNLENFKMKYQSYDVLIIDDIQYMNAGAEKTQEMFFYFFNYLYDRKRQIIIAPDRPSNELPIHDRLKSRFVTGVQVDIKPPDSNIKTQILKKYSDAFDLNLSSEIINYISENMINDTRSLLGAINDLHIYKKSFGLLFFNMETVKEIISNRIVKRSKNEFDYENLIDLVCAEFGQHRKDILGKSRKSEFIIPRHSCIFLLHELYDINKTFIGRIFGIKHTAVIHAIAKIEELLKQDQVFYRKIEKIRSGIQFK